MAKERPRLTRLFSEFFNSEKSGGIVLLACTIISIVLANSSWASNYISFWHTEFQGHDLTHWINDGLMAIFFLLIGLELEREVYAGELSSLQTAALPVVAAIGGVLVPAGIYVAFNYGSPEQSGAGIPMATDIAFAIGMLSMLGKRVPASLKIFLTALAVMDDLCAILVIAIFYTSSIHWNYLLIGAGIFAAMLVLNRMKVHNLIPYLIGGVALWYCMLHSGIHATLAGVLTAFAIPFGSGNKISTSYILQHWLHAPVAYVIVPIFALANTSLVFEGNWSAGLFTSAGLGIYIGLVLGKPLGILLFSRIAVALNWCRLPEDISWKTLAGAGILGGIGFTMSIFITTLAFSDAQHILLSKMAILFASLTASLLGLGWLYWTLPKNIQPNNGA